MFYLTCYPGFGGRFNSINSFTLKCWNDVFSEDFTDVTNKRYLNLPCHAWDNLLKNSTKMTRLILLSVGLRFQYPCMFWMYILTDFYCLCGNINMHSNVAGGTELQRTTSEQTVSYLSPTIQDMYMYVSEYF